MLLKVTSAILLALFCASNSAQAETYRRISGNDCRSAISSQIESADSIPWWARGTARRIAYRDIRSIRNGETTPDVAAAALKAMLLDKGMDEGWANSIQGQYRSALQSLSNGPCR